MTDYERIARIIRFLDQHRVEQPSLAILSEVAGLSRFHLHRLFSIWAGVTPKEFLQCLTLAEARRRLRQGEDALTAALAAGLSGPGRLHDLCVRLEAASPGELKSGGAGWTLVAGFTDTPFGKCLVGESPRGICHLSFLGPDDPAAAMAALQADWPAALLQRDDAHAARLLAPAFEMPKRGKSPVRFRAFVRGSGFQVRVWRALLQVPAGALVSYGRLAAALEHPSAARAVGSAVARNPIAFLIPCHRVIRETGALGEYRWDPARKRAMVAWENAWSWAHQSQRASRHQKT